MADQETLRLAAEVVDKFSGPIKEMQRSIRTLNDYVKTSHAEGIRHTQSHERSVRELGDAMGSVAERVRGVVGPALAGLGLTTISLAGSIAAITAAVRDFAYAVPALSALSRETGISVNQLRVLEALGERVGASGHSMAAGISAFNEHMARFRRQAPEELNMWLQMGPAVYAFGQSIRNLPRIEQIERVLGFAQTIRDPDQRRRFLISLGLPPELQKYTRETLDQAIKDITGPQGIGKLTEEAIKRAEETKRAFDLMSESVRHLKEDFAEALAPAITEATNVLRRFIRENQGDLVALAKDLANLPWKDIVDGAKWATGQVRDLVSGLRELIKEVHDFTSGGNTIWELLFGKDAYIDPNSPIGWLLEFIRASRHAGETTGGPPLPGTTSIEKAPRAGGAGGPATFADRFGFPGGGPQSAIADKHTEEAVSKGAEKGIYKGLTDWFQMQKAAAAGTAGAAPFGDRFGSWPGGGAPGGGGPGSLAPGARFRPGVPMHGGMKGTVGPGGDPRGLSAYIREQAALAGIDPNVALRVAQSEGLRDFTGDRGTSFGAFQLHTGGGLGDEFRKETGLNPADPKNERATIAWALRKAARTGWGPWHGAANTGIGQWQGISREGGLARHWPGHPQSFQAGRGPRGTELPAPSTANTGAVDPRLREVMGAAASHLGEGYSVRVTPHGGYSPTHGDSGSQHRRGRALDVQIVGPHGEIANVGSDPTGKYRELARHAYGEMQARYPDLADRFAWGGAFPVRSGAPDLMHYDIGGARGRWIRNRPQQMGPVPGVEYGPHGGREKSSYLGGGLSRAARDAGIISDRQTIKGDASLRIDLNGFPQGTRTRMAHSGMFREVTLNRGKPMALASETA